MRSGRALRLAFNAPSTFLRGTEGEVSATPSIGSRIADSSLSCYWVIRVDAHAPFDKGRLRGLETHPLKRLRGFARWGSVQFARDRGRGSSPSVGPPG
jgi:hypothetical protein